jgi:hypothetical protein
MMPGRKERKEGRKGGDLLMRALKMSQIFEFNEGVDLLPKHNILLLAMIQWEGFEACLGFIRVSVELGAGSLK